MASERKHEERKIWTGRAKMTDEAKQTCTMVRKAAGSARFQDGVLAELEALSRAGAKKLSPPELVGASWGPQIRLPHRAHTLAKQAACAHGISLGETLAWAIARFAERFEADWGVVATPQSADMWTSSVHFTEEERARIDRARRARSERLSEFGARAYAELASEYASGALQGATLPVIGTNAATTTVSLPHHTRALAAQLAQEFSSTLGAVSTWALLRQAPEEQFAPHEVTLELGPQDAALIDRLVHEELGAFSTRREVLEHLSEHVSRALRMMQAQHERALGRAASKLAQARVGHTQHAGAALEGDQGQGEGRSKVLLRVDRALARAIEHFAGGAQGGGGVAHASRREFFERALELVFQERKAWVFDESAWVWRDTPRAASLDPFDEREGEGEAQTEGVHVTVATALHVDVLAWAQIDQVPQRTVYYTAIARYVAALEHKERAPTREASS